MKLTQTFAQDFLAMWEDQAAFNTLFRQPPVNDEQMAKQIRDFVLYIEDELHELLRVVKWKEHRNQTTALKNVGHMNDELADVLKTVMSIFQICGWTPDDLIHSYWRKTAVVRQRYQEEWVNQLVGPCAVIDIDNVLCDYVTGMCDWLLTQMDATCPTVLGHAALNDTQREQVLHIREQGSWIDAIALGVSQKEWQNIKHQFRISGAKRHLPCFPDAENFLFNLKVRGLKVVLLTSRPIDRYPNIYTDTLLWLQQHHLHFDFLWWAVDKKERILESHLRDHVRLVVDDDRRHLEGFDRLDGAKTYLMCRHASSVPTLEDECSHTPVRGLTDVLDRYDTEN